MSWLLQPGSARRLGVSRGLFYAWYAVQVVAYDPAAYARLPRELWQPVLLLRPFGQPSAIVADVAVIVLLVALAFAAVGLFTRLATSLVAVLGTVSVGWMACFGAVNFHFTPLVLISWILPFSACGAACSLDALRGGSPPPAEDPAFGWPIRLAWLALVLPMATAGYQKLIAGVWLEHPVEVMDWFLRHKYWAHGRIKHQVPPLWTLLPLGHPWVLGTMSVATLVLEFGAPFALFDRPWWLRASLIGGLFLLQLTLAVVLVTLPTFPWLAAYVFWVPWQNIQLRRRASA